MPRPGGKRNTSDSGLIPQSEDYTSQTGWTAVEQPPAKSEVQNRVKHNHQNTNQTRLQPHLAQSKDPPMIKPRGLSVAETEFEKSGAAPVEAYRPHRTVGTGPTITSSKSIPDPFSNAQLGGSLVRDDPELVRKKDIQILLDKYKHVFPSE